MSKRQAIENLEDIAGAASPAPKKFRSTSPFERTNGFGLASPVADSTATQSPAPAAALQPQVEDEDEEIEEVAARAPIRQEAPDAGYDDLYLDTIDRNVLDFDFEKRCSVSLSNINVYACLVCGRYFQGRGPKSHAYFHALEVGHHVYINMQTQKVYVLPEGYEVKNKSLDDIKFVSDPRYTKEEVMALDRVKQKCWALDGKKYRPGFVGMNNIKNNDYFNVVMQILSHVPPLRNYLMLEDFSNRPELVKRFSILVRKIWNPRAFKTHVSPHELLQEVTQRSNKRYGLLEQSDPVEFLSWFLNNLHFALGGSKTKPGSSIIQQIFQGRLKVESQDITAKADAGDRLRFEDSAQVHVAITNFMLLTLDLPPAPLFQDELEKNIIPQVPLSSILAKYDGVHAQEHMKQRKRYRLLHPLPPYLMFHIKRFSKNKFVDERNPTIVTFDVRNLDMSPYVEPSEKHPPGEPIWYDLVANIVHEAVRVRADSVEGEAEKHTWKVQLLNRASGKWVQTQDLFVEKRQQPQLLYLGESYLQVWERRREPKKK